MKCLAHVGSSPKLQVQATGRSEVGRVLNARALRPQANTQQTSSQKVLGSREALCSYAKAVILDDLCCLEERTILSPQI